MGRKSEKPKGKKTTMTTNSGYSIELCSVALERSTMGVVSENHCNYGCIPMEPAESG